MVRLGFNLVRQKESSKNVEAGVVVVAAAADQQNASNESVEIGELILAIEERNRRISNLLLLSRILTAVIIFLTTYIIFTQSNLFRSDQADAAETQDVVDYASQVEALKGEYDALRSESQEQLRNRTSEVAARTKLEEELATERSLREAGNLESRRRYEALHSSFEALLRKNEELGSQCREVQEELKTELRKLGDERAELERNLAEASRSLERTARQSKPSPTTPTPVTTTTTKTKAKSADAPEYIKRINVLVKDIESGAAIFNINEFMKKADEVLRF